MLCAILMQWRWDVFEKYWEYTEAKLTWMETFSTIISQVNTTKLLGCSVLSLLFAGLKSQSKACLLLNEGLSLRFWPGKILERYKIYNTTKGLLIAGRLTYLIIRSVHWGDLLSARTEIESNFKVPKYSNSYFTLCESAWTFSAVVQLISRV